MSETKQSLDKHEKNVEPITTGKTYAPAGTSIDTDLAGDKNGPTITPQSAASPVEKGISTGLARALMGGLIGATLGTLAGALANKRTAKSANYATKGVSEEVKTVAEGVNQAALGVGNAAKSVAEGINYAVVGGLVDVVKNTALDAKESIVSALDTVKRVVSQKRFEDIQSFSIAVCY